MIIRQNGFNIPIPKKRPKLLVLTGNEPFLMNYFKQILIKTWYPDPEQLSIYRFDTPKQNTFEDALNAMQHRDLFATDLFINVLYEKNQLDKAAKAYLDTCVIDQHTDCLILFQAPFLSEKKLAFLSSHSESMLLHIKTPAHSIVERWISEQLQHAGFRSALHIPRLIVQYTQGNLLACSQVIEKIKLCYTSDKALDLSDIKPLLSDQSIYQLYELRDACLLGAADKALGILKYIFQVREEPILILWTLTQEIRQLIRLHEYQLSGEYTLTQAFNQLKIWRTQESLYRKALLRLNHAILLTMLTHALQLDSKIKTSHTDTVKIEFERMITALCLGKYP